MMLGIHLGKTACLGASNFLHPLLRPVKVGLAFLKCDACLIVGASRSFHKTGEVIDFLHPRIYPPASCVSFDAAAKATVRQSRCADIRFLRSSLQAVEWNRVSTSLTE